LIRVDVSQLGSAVAVAAALARAGLLTKVKGHNVIRMTTNREVSEADLPLVKAALASVSSMGFHSAAT
jgi:hypothetical protein